MSWGQIGRELAGQLEGISDERTIEAMALETMQAICEEESTPEKRANALKMLNREILKKFPRKENKAKSYYHDPAGKADLPKWRHLIFKYLTLDSSDWDAVGGEAREVSKAKNLSVEASPSEPTQPTEQTPKQQRTRKSKEFLKTMTIKQLNLDTDTEQTLEEALAHSGMALEDFIKQAIKVYAKTIAGKAKQRSEDLSNVSTEELLNDAKWKTQPGRAEELTKRAITAIIRFNTEVASENADRWKITQSAIASLTGSRPQVIGEIIKQYQTMVDDHNSKPEYGFTDYTNRKSGRKITDVINLSELVPDGIG